MLRGKHSVTVNLHWVVSTYKKWNWNFFFSAGSLDYIEEEYVDLDWKENVSTEKTEVSKLSKRVQPFAIEDFEENYEDGTGSGQGIDDDEDSLQSSTNSPEIVEEGSGGGDISKYKLLCNQAHSKRYDQYIHSCIMYVNLTLKDRQNTKQDLKAFSLKWTRKGLKDI